MVHGFGLIGWMDCGLDGGGWREVVVVDGAPQYLFTGDGRTHQIDSGVNGYFQG